MGPKHAIIGTADRRRKNLDQYLACYGFRFRHLPDLQYIRGPIACTENCFHDLTPLQLLFTKLYCDIRCPRSLIFINNCHRIIAD